MSVSSFHQHTRDRIAEESKQPSTVASAVDPAWDEYRRNPSQDAFEALHTAHADTLSSAIKSAGGDPDELRIPAVKILKSAADSYDPTKGTAFRTHLYNNLKGLSRPRWEREFMINVPERVRQRKSKLLEFRRSFESENNRPPNDDEVFEALGATEKQIERADSGSRMESNESSGPSAYAPTAVKTNVSSDHDLLLESVYEDAVSNDDSIGQDILLHHFRYKDSPRLKQSDIAARHGVSSAAISKRVKKLRELLGDRYW